MSKIVDGVEMVAIVTTHTYGAGLSTWGHGSALDQRLAEAIEFGAFEPIRAMLKERGAEQFIEPEELHVTWVPKGTPFRIDEYDGMEILITPESLHSVAV